MFDQGGKIDHCTHVPYPVSQNSAEREYNSEYTLGMALENVRMLNNEFLNKGPYVVP